MAKNQVIVSILGDTRDLQSKLDGSGGALSKWAGAAAVAGAAVAAAIGAAAFKGVKSASELEQAMGGMGAVFADNATQMEAWAASADKSLGLAKSEYATLATVLGSQMKNMGVATDQLGGKTHDLIGMGADLAAQFGGSTSDAVGALSSLLRGERDPIERYGVSINEAAVKAKMAEMGLSGLSGEAEKNAKLQATLALLTEQTASAQGAFARESTTLAGAQQRLSAQTENLFAMFGSSLLPAVTAVTAAAGQLMSLVMNSKWFDSLTASIGGASERFADFVFSVMNGEAQLDFSGLFAGILPAVIGGVQSAAQWIKDGGTLAIVDGLNAGRTALLDGALQLFRAIAEALPQIVPPLLTAALIMVQDVINLLVASAPQILATAALMFGALVDSLVLIIPQLVTGLVNMLPLLVESLLAMVPALLAGAIQLFTSLVAAIPLIIPPLIAAVVALLPELVSSVVAMIPGLIDGAVQLFTALVNAIPVVLPVLLRAILDLLPSLLGSLVSMLPALLNGAVQLFTGLVSAIPRIIPQLIGAIIGLLPQIVGTLIGMVPQLIRAGVDLIAGLVRGLGQAAGSVGAALLKIAQDAVGGFLSFLGIKSPSRLFMGYGKNTVQGLVQGLTRNAGMVDGAMGALSERVADGFSASLTAPEIDYAFAGHAASSAARSAAPVYQIHVEALNPTAETGRVIVEAIRDYEDAGGRL